MLSSSELVKTSFGRDKSNCIISNDMDLSLELGNTKYI